MSQGPEPVEEIFHKALELPPDQRREFVRVQCGDNESLYREVESLLSYDDEDGAFLSTPAVETWSDVDAREKGKPLQNLPDLIASYRVEDVLGQGGMGIVFKARQESPARTVALKVIRPGLASESAIRRFSQEAELLGRFQHVGIAQIFEAGTVQNPSLFGELGSGDEVPFFAMELVEGANLLEHARSAALSVHARLALLARVCDAVHHAHLRGVVHRDLKPSNILVVEDQSPTSDGTDTADLREVGQPKILDFGIARTTEVDFRETQNLTHHGQMLGTIGYMSPEQCHEDPSGIDVRSDVYSLGVIGYELLADQLPLDLSGHSWPTAVKKIQEEDPTKLGTIDTTLRGDIETLIAKALEKDRDRRYGSAAELGADIRRYLRNEPIEARPRSQAYTLRKFAKRHRGLVASSVFVFAVLLAAVVLVSREALRARQAESLAVDRAIEAEQIQRLLSSALESAKPQAGRGPDVTVRELLDAVSVDIEGQVFERPAVEMALRKTLTSTYSSLSLPRKAEPHARRLVELCKEIRGETSEDALEAKTLLAANVLNQFEYGEADELLGEVEAELASSYPENHRLVQLAGRIRAGWYRYQGRQPEAIELLRKLRGQSGEQGAEDTSRLQVTAELSRALDEAGAYEEAASLAEELLATQVRVLGVHHREAIDTRIRLSDVLRALGLYDEAIEQAQQALESSILALGERSPVTVRSGHTLGLSLYHGGRLAEAERALEEAVARGERYLPEEHADLLYAKDIRVTVLYANEKLPQAETLAREMVATRKALSGEGSGVALNATHNLARILGARGQLDQAEQLQREVLEGYKTLRGGEHPDTLGSMTVLAITLMQKGDFEDAESLLRDQLDVERELYGDTNPGVMTSTHQLALAIMNQGRLEEAREILEDLVDVAQEAWPEGHWSVAVYQATLGECCMQQRDYPEAEEQFLNAYHQLEETFGKNDARARELATGLARLYETWGRPQDAERWR